MFQHKDIHTHDFNRKANAIINISPDQEIETGAVYSVGIHPWHVETADENALQLLTQKSKHPQVVAIGETGLDPTRGDNIALQHQLLLHHIKLSEETGKPLILHIVKRYNDIIALHAKLRPASAWIIHGFRGKPQLAQELLRHGFYLSLGEKFNHETAGVIPENRLFYESDESLLSIDDIITRIKKARDNIAQTK